MLETIKKLKSRRSKRVFLFVTFLFLLLVSLSLYATITFKARLSLSAYDILYSILIELIAATITAIVIFSTISALLGEESKFEYVKVLDPLSTKLLHKRALEHTDVWNHNGHFGRWVRTTALPVLAHTSIERGIITHANFCILNPKNEELCRKYIKYRNRITFKDPAISSLKDVQLEILSSIIVAHMYHRDSTGLTVNVHLKDCISMVREDMTSEFVFRTHINPLCSSIVYFNIDGKCEHYNTVLTDFQYAVSLSTKLNLDFDVATPGAELINTLYAKEVLKRVNCLISDEELFLKDIVKRAISDYHPYN